MINRGQNFTRKRGKEETRRAFLKRSSAVDILDKRIFVSFSAQISFRGERRALARSLRQQDNFSSRFHRPARIRESTNQETLRRSGSGGCSPLGTGVNPDLRRID